MVKTDLEWGIDNTDAEHCRYQIFCANEGCDNPFSLYLEQGRTILGIRYSHQRMEGEFYIMTFRCNLCGTLQWVHVHESTARESKQIYNPADSAR